MAVLVSPGVLTREIDLSLYIPALTSTIVAMVGTASKGDVNVLKLITDGTQLAKEVGNSDPNHPAVLGAQWYLKLGRQLWFVRVANLATLASAVGNLVSSAAGPAVVTGTGLGPFTFAAATAASVTGTEVGPFNISAGVNDALKIAVDAGLDQDVTLTPGATRTAQDVVDDINAGTDGLTASISGGKIVLTSNTTGSTSSVNVKTVALNAYTTLGFTVGIVSGANGNDVLAVAITGGASQNFTLPAGAQSAQNVADSINDTLVRAVASVVNGYLTFITTATGAGVSIQVSSSAAATLLSLNTSSHVGTDVGSTSVIATASSPGTWGNKLTIKIADSVTVVGAKNLYVIEDGFVKELFKNLVKDTASASYWETVINGHSEYITVVDQVGVVTQPGNIASVHLGDGNDGLTGLTDGDFIGIQGDGYSSGMQLFADPATVDINLLVVPGQSSMNIHAAMVTLVSSRADSMCIVDPPSSLTPTQVGDFRRGLNAYSSRVALDTNRAAMYYPWLQGYDPANKVTVLVPPSMGALYSYIFNDTVAQLWFAPMGVNRGLIPPATGIERKLREGEKDFLYEIGINPIMAYPNYGITIMGEKTLQAAPTSLDRVNVRRLLDYLHKAVVTSTFVLIGEPNTPRLWRRLTALLQPLMQSIKDQEGVTAYQVVCDSSTNPQNLVNAHEVHAKIGILPTPDAEFIYTDFVLVGDIATFQDYLAPAK